MLTYLVPILPLFSLISAFPHSMNHTHHHNCTNATNNATSTRHTHTPLHTRSLTDLWIGFSDGCNPDSDGTSIPKQNRTTVPVIAHNHDYWQNFEPNDPKPCIQVYWGKTPPDPNTKDSINQIVLHRGQDMKGESISLTWRKDDQYKQQQKKNCYHLQDFAISDGDKGKGWGSMHSAHANV